MRTQFTCSHHLAPLAICVLGGFLLASSASESPMAIGNRRQLFFDGRFVERATNVQFVVHPPRKTGEIIVASEPGAALGGYHSVLLYGGVYHLWYMAGGGVLYARSVDGIHWEKPHLRLAAKPSTNAANLRANLVLGYGVGDVKGGMHGLQVFIDPNAADEQKFKLVANPEDYDRKIQVWSSPDGIHWKHTHRDVIGWKGDKPHLDSQNVIFWDDPLAKYVAYYRLKLRQQGSPMRVVARAESPDFAHFPPAEDGKVVMRSDTVHPGKKDPKGGKIAVLDTYTNGTLKYPWADDAYFMFPTDYYHYGPWHGEFRDESPVNAGALDTRLAVSRDGIIWKRPDSRPFIALGMKGEFDSARVYVAYGVVPAPNGRELYMYYLGTSETHGWDRDDKNNRLLTAAGLAPTGPSVLSRVVLRRDGFVSVRAAYSGGEFTTPLLKFAGGQLLLNVDTSASGELQVEILDEQGQPVSGFALADCDVVHTANDINRVVSWKRQTDVSSLAGTLVRLRFVFRDTDFYAFQFAERGGI